MDRKETRLQLEELAEQIYELLGEMEAILDELEDPMIAERAKSYWMAHIDGALENRKGYLGGSFISFRDTLKELE